MIVIARCNFAERLLRQFRRSARIILVSEVNALMGHSNVADVPLRRPASGTHSGRSVRPVGATPHAPMRSSNTAPRDAGMGF